MTAATKILGPRLTRLLLTPRWGDLDALNHVNNAAYLSYLEEARVQWFGQTVPTWSSDRQGPILAAAHVDYRRPILWPAQLLIDLHAGRSGRSSLTLDHVIRDAGDESIVYAEGHTVVVWVDYDTGRPTALPGVLAEH